MSTLTLIWILSIAAATAFVVAGYLFGRRVRPVVPVALPTTTPTPATGGPPVAVAALTEDPRGPRRTRLPTVDASFTEGRLAQALRRLDPDRILELVILSDASGLPLAVAEGGRQGAVTAIDPELLAALAAAAHGLMTRVEGAVAPVRALTLQLGDAARIEVRPATTAIPTLLVTAGESGPSDARVTRFIEEIQPWVRA